MRTEQSASLKFYYPVVVRITGFAGIALLISMFMIFPRAASTLELDEEVQKLADAITRYLIGDRKQAVRQLAMLASKIDVEVDQDNYNQQYGDTHRAILKVLKRIM